MFAMQMRMKIRAQIFECCNVELCCAENVGIKFDKFHLVNDFLVVGSFCVKKEESIYIYIHVCISVVIMENEMLSKDIFVIESDNRKDECKILCLSRGKERKRERVAPINLTKNLQITTHSCIDVTQIGHKSST